MPTDGFAEFMSQMLAAGMTERELAQMTKDNPARLLGLPVN
jgi:predicted metal-dependent phosphotriesterase family hydrolase